MGVGAGLYMCDVVNKFTFAISSPDELLYFCACAFVMLDLVSSVLCQEIG